jgi:hypothetical protein
VGDSADVALRGEGESIDGAAGVGTCLSAGTTCFIGVGRGACVGAGEGTGTGTGVCAVSCAALRAANLFFSSSTGFTSGTTLRAAG